jgi:uncharacterized protein (DUF2252 family)
VAVHFVQRFNAEERLDPPALAGKCALLKQGPHGFYRGNPALFFADVRGAFAGWCDLLGRSAPRIVIAGDPHLGNFGTFRGADGSAVWGLNDFDQGGTGSPEWDLERLATSAVLTARQAGLDVGGQRALAERISGRYLAAMDRLARGQAPGRAQLAADEAHGPVKEVLARAAAARRKDLLARYTHEAHGGHRFLSNAELRPVAAARAAAVKAALEDYQQGLQGETKAARPLRLVDLAEKLGSGGSSFGLLRYYALVANADPAKKPVILELKQLLPPPLDDPSGDLRRADGRQVVDCQRALGAYTNPLTGPARISGLAYLVREREPEKDGVPPEEVKDAKGLEQLCEQAAEVLARSHAQRDGQAAALHAWARGDPEQVAARLADFALLYAVQTEADWKAFNAAV